MYVCTYVHSMFVRIVVYINYTYVLLSVKLMCVTCVCVFMRNCATAAQFCCICIRPHPTVHSSFTVTVLPIPAATVWGCTEEEGLAQLQSHMYVGPWSGTAQGEWMRKHSHLHMYFWGQCVLTVYLLWNCTLRDTLVCMAIVSSWFMSGPLCWSCMENLCTYVCTYAHKY